MISILMATDSFQIIETRATSLPELGALIRRKRKASKLRIDDAAALCGVSVGTLSRLENGKAAVTTDKVLQVLDGLGLALLVVDRERLGAVNSAARSEK
jgi:transcriptional regulator with XRE-family HTH domain